MEPVTTLSAGLVVIGSKDILNKILGPTAEYLGSEMKGLVQKCNLNLDNIFVRSQKKLGSRLDEKGHVSPRVLKHILDEGKFCDDPIVADYYAGVLAASKTDVGRDDRGVSILAAIKDLSAYQVRLHYLFYQLVYRFYKGRGLNLGTDRKNMSVFIPMNMLKEGMQLSDKENLFAIAQHCLQGLSRTGLIETNWLAGAKDFLEKKYPFATSAGIVLSPSLFGAETFLWSQGLSGAVGIEFTESTLQLPEPEFIIPNGAIPER